MLLPTRYKRDKHTTNEHVSHVIVGETNVILTKAGFPCPGCVSVLKNAKEFSRHILKLHNLTCKLITDPKPLRFTVQESPIPGSNASSDSTSHSFTNTDTDTLTDTNTPTNTVRSSSVYSFEFPSPAANDRFKFMDTDISECFHKFQLAVKATIDQEPTTLLMLEAHVQHILALSGILLLKPGRTHADLHRHIDLDTCDRLLNHILTSILITRHHIFPSDIKDSVENIVKRIVNPEPLVLSKYTGPYTRMYASREIMALVEGATLSPTNRILFVIRNMVECLPRNIIGDGPQEIELTTRCLQSALVPLFEDIDASIVFRWTSVSDDEKIITTRPDASMNIACGASLGQRIGCGEVKPQ
ncbi:hypothetical protein MAM1_0203d07915 [Mucor ambiguus]|uniref:Uncharacterized protein n=1 Tax=Mucor ambiguus TaxID=91626 RepID=A0A0C9MLK1_9FUNG|nr:hypothetical protein MAM1_0203d07915 [Mucor ambiguus]